MTSDETTDIEFPLIDAPLNQQSILVATDGSADAERAVTWAAEQAYAERRPLVVLTAVGAPESHAVTWSGMGTAYAVSPRELLTAGKAVAEEGAGIARRIRPGVDVTSVVRVGEPRMILDKLSHEVQMIVVGSRGRGPLRSKLLGSVSASVCRDASCPVVVCRPTRPSGEPHRGGVLVAADGTAESLPVIEFAFRQAALTGAPLTVVYCVWEADRITRSPMMVSAEDSGLDEYRLVLAENLAGLCSKFPEVAVDQQLGFGLVEDLLTEESTDWDLVVVGRHPVDTLLRFLTTAIATGVVERARTTVAVVPEDAPGRTR